MNDYSNFIGKVLDKRYKIFELVGVGGMACVLRAQDLVMNRIVAIKILNDEYNGNEQAEHRFIDESKAVAMLSHKNIVSIYDVAIYPDIKYIVMEYLDGITLREYLDNKGALPWNEACIYILQVLRALEHAHSKGVVHRDIKPQNIILQKDGEIKVMDFGIAKIPTSAGSTGDKAVGTVYYIAPEQASGRETDTYSDLYSVGILLYEAVTGTLPFKASSPMAVAAMQVNDEPPNPRDLVLSIPVGVSQIILKAMMKDPAERFRSAHSMAKAIEWVLRNPDVIFSLSGEESSTIGDTSVVSIDMIDTAEIKPYDEDEIAQSLGKKTISEREKEKKKKEEKEAQKKKRAAKRRRRRRSHSGTLFPVIAGIFFPFLLVALILGIMLGVTFVRDLFFAEDTTVTASFPNLVHQVYSDELVSKLQNGTYGYTFLIDEGAIQYSYNQNFANGEIISTVPAANTRKVASIEQGRPVFHFTTILINRVETTSVMPDVVGYTRSDARVLLTSTYGIDASCIEFATETDPARNVLFDDQITRTEPEAGQEYKAGDTITIFLCKRNESSQTDAMPNCVGMNIDDARRLCSYALFTVRIEDVPTLGGDNTVLEQSISPGQTRTRMSEVTLRVSRQITALPDLTSGSLPEARNTLNALGVAYQETVYNIPRGSSVTGYTDLQALLQQLSLLGGEIAVNPIVTGETAVIFQSVPANGPVPGVLDPPLILIAVNYVEPAAPVPDEPIPDDAPPSA